MENTVSTQSINKRNYPTYKNKPRMHLHVNSHNLLSEFNARNEQAFKIIFTEYRVVVFNLANNLLGNIAEAQDITQEVFVTLWGASHQQFAEQRNIKAFLLTVTRNKSIDAIRNLKRHNARQKEVMYLLETKGDSFLEGEEMYAEFVEQVYKYIEKLPKKCRQVYILSLKGLSSDEISKQLGISTSTVKSQRGRGTELLRVILLRKGLLPALLYLASLHSAFKN
jgi:RNA polymerase sigma-70 factor (family 1)